MYGARVCGRRIAPSLTSHCSSPFLCFSGCVDDLALDDPIRVLLAEDIADMERRQDNAAFQAILADWESGEQQ